MKLKYKEIRTVDFWLQISTSTCCATGIAHVSLALLHYCQLVHYFDRKIVYFVILDRTKT